MNIPFWVARRYVFARHSFNFITIITTISIVGIAIGVAALISVTSIFNGFRMLAETLLIGFDPHVRVSAAEGAWIESADSLAAELESMEYVKAVSPVISGKVVASVGKTIHVFQLHGVDSAGFMAVSGLRRNMVGGAFQLSPQDGRPQVILGIALADKIGSFVDDSLMLLSPAALEQTVIYSALPAAQQARVSGIFQLNHKEYDAFHGYTSQSTARNLFKAPAGAAMYLDIRSQDVKHSDEIAAALRAKLGDNYHVETWYDLHRELYNVMRFERMAAFTVLTIIILIAVFNVFASLTMTVKEKHAEIGILKALGATPKMIIQIFINESIVIGGIGTLGGALLGLGLCLGQQEFGWFALDTSKYIVPAIPVEIHSFDVIFTIVLALGLTLLAGWYPARSAAQVRTARALMIEQALQ